jgi:hypothetical protein
VNPLIKWIRRRGAWVTTSRAGRQLVSAPATGPRQQLVRGSDWSVPTASLRWRPSGELLARPAGKLTRGAPRAIPSVIGDVQPRTPGAPRSAELGYSPAGFGQRDLLKPI